ncbi:hypothetical protein IQ250_19820, partial [Pseudanabaenaceae cyanobacterium LEGE 13415]|nr:hypothetical protein [Pseudanabaenaceae cyanobacterium LEGE 13415]
MPRSDKKSHGEVVQARTRRVLRAILTEAATQDNPRKMISRWQEQPGAILTIETTLLSLMYLTNQDREPQITSGHVRESLEAMRDFLGILQDHRTQTKGSAKWNFTLTLWDQQRVERNLAGFD